MPTLRLPAGAAGHTITPCDTPTALVKPAPLPIKSIDGTWCGGPDGDTALLERVDG